MSDDVCDCGICEVETCDVCGEPVAWLDDVGEAWCRKCWENYLDNQSAAAYERVLAQWHGGDDWLGQTIIRRQIKEGGR